MTDKVGKANLLAAKFFPKPPEAGLTDMEGYKYSEEVDFSALTDHDVNNAVRDVSNNKSSGDDEIANRAIILLFDQTDLLPMLRRLFQACLTIHYRPEHFKKSITVSLRKPDKGFYTSFKNYRSIALLSTIGKAFESILANRLAWAAETCGLLPNLHICVG